MLRSPVAPSLLAVATRNHQLRVWDLARGVRGATFTNHTAAILCLAFSPDGRWLASAGDSNVWLWPLFAPSVSPRIITPYPADATGVAFSPDSKHLITCGRDPVIHVWNLTSESQTPASFRRHTAHVYKALVSPDGTGLASAGADGAVQLWPAAPSTETDTSGDGAAFP